MTLEELAAALGERLPTMDSATATHARVLFEEALRQRCVSDGLFYLRFVCTRDEADTEHAVKPFPHDKEYVREVWQALVTERRVVVAKSRQMLLSWIMCAFATWWARFKPHQAIYWQTQKFEDACEKVATAKRAGGYLGRCHFIEEHLPAFLQQAVVGSEGQLVYPNGSLVQGLPGGADQVRGKVASVIVEDEFAFQAEADGVYTAVAPLVQKGAKFIAVSTPNGSDNTFAKLYHEAAQLGFTALTVHYSKDPEKNPHATDPSIRAAAQQWLDEARRAFPDPNRWNQEMEINWWTSEGKRVFPQFTQALHSPTSLRPNPRKVLYRSWDFGFLSPACLVATIDSKDRLLVLKEIVGKDTSTREFGQRVVDQCVEWFPNWAPGFEDFADPAGQQAKSIESERSEKRDVEVLQSLGIYPTHQYGWSRKDARALIHQLLVPREDGSPSLLVDPSGCPTLLQAFLGKFVFPPRQAGKVAEEPDENDHPWSDVQAALRYLVIGLYNVLGLRRFRYQPILRTQKVAWHGYGTAVASHSVRGGSSLGVSRVQGEKVRCLDGPTQIS